MSKFSSTIIDFTDCNPLVDIGIDEEAITIYEDGDLVRMSFNTVAKAFLKGCEHGMRESVIDADAIKVIRKYLGD